MLSYLRKTNPKRNDIAFVLSIIVKKYFDSTDKGNELLNMMKPEVTDTRLRDVIEYEVNYAIQTYEKELEEKDNVISEIDKENKKLKEILKANNIHTKLIK